MGPDRKEGAPALLCLLGSWLGIFGEVQQEVSAE